LLVNTIEKLAAETIVSDLDDHEVATVRFPVQRRARDKFGAALVESHFRFGQLYIRGAAIALVQGGLHNPHIAIRKIWDFAHYSGCPVAAVLKKAPKHRAKSNKIQVLCLTGLDAGGSLMTVPVFSHAKV
jgi:hypothetical protein